MKRNIEKDYNDYLKLTERNKGFIFLSEIEKIREMAQGDIITAEMISFGVGIMAGYRLAKRENKQRCCRNQR